ncbi:ABC transporter ATP-binding protein [Gimesia aquarii]|uniref:Putative ABC transporter ATP-binding protein YbbL n=1 Tax=Gimesia aquarii TaxID=2527964 RepID=A0A517VXK7_9PLAN|nr:ATP-binding cassette domain-containing protein [Gimesia aquarii]QDT97735.1 putative ABC transporter ATP-binding protein YbbL [Gimesia aquarii]
MINEPKKQKPALLAAQQLGRQTATGQWLIRNLSLTIHSGDRIAIVGPTGSGKSLFLRSLAILDEIQEGEIQFHGKLIKDKQIPHFRSQVVYLQQRPVLIEGTVQANLEFALKFQTNQHKPQDTSAVLNLLNSFERPEEFLHRHSSLLSGGEGQIVALLRALVLSPQVLLLDEPTSALDQQTAKLFESIILTWMETSELNPAFVWITHDQSQAQRIASQIMTFPTGNISESQKTS